MNAYQKFYKFLNDENFDLIACSRDGRGVDYPSREDLADLGWAPDSIKDDANFFKNHVKLTPRRIKEIAKKNTQERFAKLRNVNKEDIVVILEPSYGWEYNVNVFIRKNNA